MRCWSWFPPDALAHASPTGTIVMIAIAIVDAPRSALARARSDFVAGVSHDLRMPLAQILIASETLTLQRERDETQRLELAGSIVREARRLIALVENVLFFSRSGAVELSPQISSVTVGTLFDDVVESVHLAVDDARQTIDVREGASLAVLADRPLVRQALANLVDNALARPRRTTHSSRGQTFTRARPFVRGRRGPESPDRSDQCSTRTRPVARPGIGATGTGLGLAVVRNIAQAWWTSVARGCPGRRRDAGGDRASGGDAREPAARCWRRCEQHSPHRRQSRLRRHAGTNLEREGYDVSIARPASRTGEGQSDQTGPGSFSIYAADDERLHVAATAAR